MYVVFTGTESLRIHARAQGLLTQKGGASKEGHFEKTDGGERVRRPGDVERA